MEARNETPAGKKISLIRALQYEAAQRVRRAHAQRQEN